MTPEAKVKRAVRMVLARYGADVFVHMPVPNGYGRSVLDYMGCAAGIAFAIETKRKGGVPTPRQEAVIEQMRRAGAKVFVIDGETGLDELDQWLATVVDGAKVR